MARLTPCLWFDGKAEEAARFYTSIFGNSRISRITRYEAAGAKASGRPQGSVMTAEFELDGQAFLALNGSPEFPFSPAVSFMVNCDSQEEVDEFWDRLCDGGEAQQCGWLKDRFGVSWQVVPTALGEMLQDEDPVKSTRVIEALLRMSKIDLGALERAYSGG